MKNMLRGAYRRMLKILYPDRCPVCDRVLTDGSLICPQCRARLVSVEEPVCMKCGRQIKDAVQEYCADCVRVRHVFDRGRAVFSYEGEMRRMLYRYKYGNRRDYTEFFAREAAARCGGWIASCGAEALIPVPLHKRKRRRRGYNQAELFAGRLAELLGLPVDAGILARVKDTTPQKKLSDKDRKLNLKNAFKIQSNVIKYNKVLLIDDIYTTGSTLDEAAKVLKQAGVESVFCLCISIGRGQ